MLQLLNTSKAMQIVHADAMRNQLSHAYLVLFQDRQYLKTCLKEVAKVILQADNRVAHLIDTEQYIDCKVFPKDGKRILVADIREIIEDSCILPMEGQIKLYILNDVQTMPTAAQNKLLKVLEEPPKSVYFILGSTQQETVLQTVQSRAKKLQFNDFSTDALLQFIDRNYPNATDTKSAILLANGSISNLQQILQEQLLQYNPHTILQKLASLQAEDILQIIKEYPDREAVCKFFASLQIVLREILLYHIGNKESTILVDRRLENRLQAEGTKESLQNLQIAAKRFKPQRILYVFDVLLQAVEDMEHNGNAVQAIYLVLLAILEGR